MFRRGFLHLHCPHCFAYQKVYIDFSTGETGWTCQRCRQWVNIQVEITSVDPAKQKGEKSPAWPAAVELLGWVPEFSKPSHYADLLDGISREECGDCDGAPFVSESFLYCAIGKEDARTFLSLVRRLLASVGIDEWEASKEAARLIRLNRERSPMIEIDVSKIDKLYILGPDEPLDDVDDPGAVIVADYDLVRIAAVPAEDAPRVSEDEIEDVEEGDDDEGQG